MKRKVFWWRMFFSKYFSHITKGNPDFLGRVHEYVSSNEQHLHYTQSEVKVHTEMDRVINPISNQKFQASVQY